MLREMLIKIENNEAYIAITGDRQLLEIFLPSSEQEILLGNIYLGKVENVLPGMQAAFINIGLGKNSFLYVEDALSTAELTDRDLEIKNEESKNHLISEVVRQDQQVMVQIFKEPTGTKGARVTMQPSLPGRFVVLLPHGNYIAVSRRIEEESERERLRS